MENVNRREFLLASAIVASAACGSGKHDAGAQITDPDPPYVLPNGARILFQGDSVTDAGHDSGISGPNDAAAMGRGYPLFLAQYLLLTRPKQQLKIFNRARGGDTVPLLQARWQADAIDMQPDLLSIFIGLNDFVADYEKPDAAATYEQNYTALVDATRTALPKVKFVIVEPYLLNPTPIPGFQDFRDIASRVAKHVDAIYVPTHDMLNKHISEDGHAYWADEQHPTIAGSAAIAKQWLQIVGL